jgi:hypothetical protein
MKIAYIDRNFRDTGLVVIDRVNRLCADYEAQGYRLTLRQIYYRLVALDQIPGDRKWTRLPTGRWVRDPDGTTNAEPNYKWLGDIINQGRLAGLIDWNHVQDRLRGLHAFSSWESPAQIVGETADAYREDVRATQPTYVEVFVEKDAMSDVVEQAADPWDVPSFACRGYTSQSALWRAARRHMRQMQIGKKCHILYLGDHDPSGLDMSNDLEQRFDLFCERHGFQPPDITRLALNFDQIEQYQPPPNPTKAGDSRTVGYVERFGDECWELDALPPDVLDTLIQEAIAGLTDMDLLDAARQQQEERRALLTQLGRRWPELEDRWDDVMDLLDS